MRHGLARIDPITVINQSLRHRNDASMKTKQPIETLILTLREQKVILDLDLAEIYGVETRVLNQAVRRNAECFPGDFLFVLTR